MDDWVAWLEHQLRVGVSNSEALETRVVNELGTTDFYIKEIIQGLAFEALTGRCGDCYVAIGSVIELELDLSNESDRRYLVEMLAAIRLGGLVVVHSWWRRTAVMGAGLMFEAAAAALGKEERRWMGHAPADKPQACQLPIVIAPASRGRGVTNVPVVQP